MQPGGQPSGPPAILPPPPLGLQVSQPGRLGASWLLYPPPLPHQVPHGERGPTRGRSYLFQSTASRLCCRLHGAIRLLPGGCSKSSRGDKPRRWGTVAYYHLLYTNASWDCRHSRKATPPSLTPSKARSSRYRCRQSRIYQSCRCRSKTTLFRRVRGYMSLTTYLPLCSLSPLPPPPRQSGREVQLPRRLPAKTDWHSCCYLPFGITL